MTVQIARILYSDFDALSYDEQIELVDRMHRIVRKGAHFTEYAVLAALVRLVLGEMLISYSNSARDRLYIALTAAAFGLFYAIFDEVHQRFVNRGASPRDVCIDFAGVIFGIILVEAMSSILRRLHRSKTVIATKGETA